MTDYTPPQVNGSPKGFGTALSVGGVVLALLILMGWAALHGFR